MTTFFVSLDEKVTTWVRHTIQVNDCKSYKEAVDKVVNSIKDNFGLYCSGKDMFSVGSEELYETEEPVKENNGFPTIEILGKKAGQVVWNNVDGYVKDNE